MLRARASLRRARRPSARRARPAAFRRCSRTPAFLSVLPLSHLRAAVRPFRRAAAPGGAARPPATHRLRLHRRRRAAAAAAPRVRAGRARDAPHSPGPRPRSDPRRRGARPGVRDRHAHARQLPPGAHARPALSGHAVARFPAHSRARATPRNSNSRLAAVSRAPPPGRLWVAKTVALTPRARARCRQILTPLVGPSDVVLNLSVDVSSVALVALCAERGALYLDTVRRVFGSRSARASPQHAPPRACAAAQRLRRTPTRVPRRAAPSCARCPILLCAPRAPKRIAHENPKPLLHSRCSSSFSPPSALPGG